MKNLKNSKTVENLLKAFAGESQARNRYTFYASVADKEGFKQIKNIFTETAENEKEHAKRFYKLLLNKRWSNELNQIETLSFLVNNPINEFSFKNTNRRIKILDIPTVLFLLIFL